MKEFVLENPPRRRRRRARRNPSRRRGMSAVRRNPRRRSGRRRVRRNPSGLGGIKLNPFNLKQTFSRQNMMVAGGAVLASILSNVTIGRFGQRLPAIGSPMGRAVYNLILPLGFAYLGRRFSPDLSKGLVIGGIANGLGQVLTATRVLPAGSVVTSSPAPLPAAPPAPQTTNEYLGEYLGEYLDDSGANAVGAAFATDAWN